MFLAWFKANKQYEEVENLTYAEFPQKFVWKSTTREWVLRQRVFAIGRIFYVPPGSGELYYLRCLLNVVRGPKSFEDIRTVNGIQYSTFRETCYGWGILDDNTEYVDRIMEASAWASAQSLRLLFATLLCSNSLSMLEVVQEKCWSQFADDIVYNQRQHLGRQGIFFIIQQLKKITTIIITYHNNI